MRHSLFKRKWNDQLYLRHFLGLIYRIIGSFLFGIAVTQLSTDIAKYSIGRLRPHFITLCQPNINMCSSQLGYIEADVCTTTDTEALREARYCHHNDIYGSMYVRYCHHMISMVVCTLYIVIT